MCFLYVSVFADADANKVPWVELDLTSCAEVVFKAESSLWSLTDLFPPKDIQTVNGKLVSFVYSYCGGFHGKNWFPCGDVLV